MARKSPPKRKYDSSRRKEQARQTRLQVAEAARGLFLERGYAGATIEAIAQQAAVAQETVYAIFGNKRNILIFLLDISVGGDDQPIALLDRQGPQAVMRNPDQRKQLSMFATDITKILERAAPVVEIMRSAAKSEPEIARLLKRMLDERAKNMIRFVKSVAANGPLRNDMNEDHAGEIAWAITSPELFQLLTVERNWTREKYIQWLTETLTRLFLP